jgi:drug/metabolite transporter (DMT)-like permease
VVLHFQLLGTITGFAFSTTNFVIPQGIDWFYLLMVGVFTQLGQVSMTKSFQTENVSKVSILVYTGVIYATLAGYLFFDEVYNVGTLAGMLMVIAGVGLSVLYRK